MISFRLDIVHFHHRTVQIYTQFLNNKDLNGLLEMFLVFLTFLMILCFQSLSQSEYIRQAICKALPNYSAVLAITVATLVSQLKWPYTNIDYIKGPSLFSKGMSTTNGRGWFISYSDVPAKAYGIAILPAIFLTILYLIKILFHELLFHEFGHADPLLCYCI